MFEEAGPIVKKEMVLFLLIDQSGSMDGSKIGAVNTAVRDVLPELREVGGADASIKIAPLLFSNGCEWMYPTPVPVEDFQWRQIEADGLTAMGEAFTELAQKMSRKAFLSAPSSSVAPAIFLLSDGEPNDDWQAGLAKLRENNWFKYAIKVAVAIGDDANVDVLAEFTGTPEAVITVHTPEALRKMIRFVSITSTQIGSKSQPTISGEPQSRQGEMTGAIQVFVNGNDGLDPNIKDGW